MYCHYILNNHRYCRNYPYKNKYCYQHQDKIKKIRFNLKKNKIYSFEKYLPSLTKKEYRKYFG